MCSNEHIHKNQVVMDVIMYDQLLEEPKAVMLIYLALQYFRCLKEVPQNGWFKVSYSEIKEKLGTSSDTITLSLKRLVEINAIEIERTNKNENFYRIVYREANGLKRILIGHQVVEKLFSVPKAALRFYIALHFFRLEQRKTGKEPIIVTRDDIKMFVGIANNTISSAREALYSIELIDYERTDIGKAPMSYIILQE